MSKKVKVSVLVPIYNVEDYLPECLDSLINQTLKEIEIICINDGSTDRSPAIIKRYMDMDSRVKVITKKNTGYGDSMNRGLSKATGEYIGIVESDDFIELDAFEKLYKAAKENDVDVSKGNFYEYFSDTDEDTFKSDMFSPEDVGVVVDPREHRRVFYEQPSIWAAIYRADFLKKNDIKFLPSPGASYQDAGFNFKVWACARRVWFTDEAFLHYRQDNPSSSIKSDGKVYAVKDEYDEVERFLNERDLMKVYGNTLTGVRFSSYAWNMSRLKKKPAKEFAKKAIAADRKRLKALEYFDEDKLGDDSLYAVNRIQVRHPRRYLLFRSHYDEPVSMKRRVLRCICKVSPVYKKSTRMIKTIGKVKKEQKELLSRVDAALEKIGEKDER